MLCQCTHGRMQRDVFYSCQPPKIVISTENGLHGWARKKVTFSGNT